MKYRIIKSREGNFFNIQTPRRDWLGRETGQWETIGNDDWAAVFCTLEQAQDQIKHWKGEDVQKNRVVEEGSY